jgi:abortive infection bacteriophage resistance protein
MAVFEALDNIEISVKTHISNIMSETYGPHWYLNPQHFISSNGSYRLTKKRKHKSKHSGTFDHGQFLLKLKRSLDHCFEPFFKHYQKNYNPIYPPSWITMELLTFGTVSLMFQNMVPSEEKKQICNAFRLPKKLLVSWLHCFTAIRNRCAHHNKLVYSRFKFAPIMPKKQSARFLAEADVVDHTSLYAILSCIQYMLAICNKESDFKYDLFRLFHKFPDISFSRLGFTPNWQTEKIWAPNDHL